LQNALDYLAEQSGKHFDPTLIALVSAQTKAIEKIYAL
jgi:response regulator RpfG family c-di-GMP phosphodiesterase